MQIRSVQLLRAIAALFVVGFHSTVLWHDKFDADVTPWKNGNSGVDLFFVISGFIMVLSSRRLLGLADGWKQFIRLRLVRIAPMYWLVTAAKLAAVTAVPALALHTRPTGWNIAASFLFIPSRDAVGAVRPVLDVGWTLSFEMLFYIVFAMAMFFALDQLAVVGPVMVVLALASLATHADWPAFTTLADPIVLEFVFGVIVARAVAGEWLSVAPVYCMILAASGVACLLLVPIDGQWQRVFIWGVAAMITLLASVLGEGLIGRYVPRLGLEVGEASYSLYLTHGFVLPVIGVVLGKAGLKGEALGAAIVVSCLVVSTVVGLVVYRVIEKPATEWLRKLVDDRRRTNLAAPETAI